ncbi:ABC-F family ATP-binding cassette domain-containing protein [Iamia sp. SCSIO 61187]|uniref:ABC-F family ATP-binding cassette domain-containing protein n=1 Tax=Iamia sp. SCSIO 61187 TaxID=2722752 RepID=UPI001C63904A|nr:ABC-F family ATP-binding cassette domain-containing protein [Iamia sp. SCSIO 61187]QYG93998.1 ABC-F family ATP-binding cassette domain-containing protein [Iamia sp. SCSIO 61187]
MLTVNGLRVDVGGTILLDGITFSVRAGDKVGIVGRNGAGKTTMLKILGGDAEPSRGTVRREGGVGYLPQDPRLDGVPDSRTGLEHVLSGRGFDEAVVRMEKLRLAMEEDPSDRAVSRFTRAEERFRLEGGYQAESEVRRLAAGLGLPDDRLDLPLAALSGGQRRRVELARILFAGSDLLFLDEPTNHLDSDAKEWLLDYMRRYRGGLIVISHDLDLLDEAITRVIHLDRGGHDEVGTLHEYRGTYSQYQHQREADEVRLRKEAAAREKEVDRLQTIVDRFGAKATKAAMAHSLEKRIARIEATATEGPKRQIVTKVRFPDPPHAGRTVLEVEDLSVSYGDLDVFADVEFSMGRGERMVVMGFNGAGKTSLLRSIAGVQEPTSGAVRTGLGVVVGYYAQEHEGLDPHRNLVDQLRDASTGQSESELRGLLGMFGLTGDKVFQEAGTLSGGEKTKLALSQLVAGRNNLLLLDEPTNNLDPGSRDAVAASLAEWPGTILLVSHDTDFVRALKPDRALYMPDGQVDYWSNDLLDMVALA